MGDPRMVKFKIQKPGGTLGSVNNYATVTIPFMTMVHIPFLRLEKVVVDFTVKLTSSRTQSLTGSQGRTNVTASTAEKSGSSFQGKYSSSEQDKYDDSGNVTGTETKWDPLAGEEKEWNQTASFTGLTSTREDAKNGNEIKKEYSLNVVITAVQDALPVGIEKMLDILEAEIKDTSGDAFANQLTGKLLSSIQAPLGGGAAGGAAGGAEGLAVDGENEEEADRYADDDALAFGNGLADEADADAAADAARQRAALDAALVQLRGRAWISTARRGGDSSDDGSDGDDDGSDMAFSDDEGAGAGASASAAAAPPASPATTGPAAMPVADAAAGAAAGGPRALHHNPALDGGVPGVAAVFGPAPAGVLGYVGAPPPSREATVMSLFADTLDYLWLTPSEPRALRVAATLPCPPLDCLMEEGGLPNARWPSDHLPIGITLRVNLQ